MEKYTDSDGEPLVLPYSGSGLSFSSLCDDTVGDLTPGAMRYELLRVGAIEDTECGVLRAIRRSMFCSEVARNVAQSLNDHVSSVSELVVNNTFGEESDRWPIFSRTTDFNASNEFRFFRTFSRKQLDVLEQNSQEFYSAYQTIYEHSDDGPESPSDNCRNQAGIVAYHFERSDDT